MKKYNLRYGEASKFRYDGLPLGSGDFGARVNSYEAYEDISLNLDTLWSGEEKNKMNPLFSPDKLEEIREHILKEEYKEAEKISKRYVLGDWTECYLPAGNLIIKYLDEDEAKTSFYRELSLDTAVYKMEAGNNSSKRHLSAFVSFCDSTLVTRLEGENRELSLQVSLDSQLHYCLNSSENRLTLMGRAPIYAAPNYFNVPEPIRYEDGKGLNFVLMLEVLIHSGEMRIKDDKLIINNADKVELYLTGDTDYKNKENLEEFCKNRLKKVREQGFDKSLTEHKEAFTPHFKTFEISLSDSENKDTVKAIKDAKDIDDGYIYELMTQYARYLLITSSKPGTECANLQGIWSDILRAPWSSNYTVNINTEMNYWIAESTGLSDFHRPLFELLEKVSKRGEETAKKMYGARGWVSHHNIDLWGHSTPVGLNAGDDNPSVYGLWQMSGGWLCRHLFEHYLYEQDEDFLRDTAYPIIDGAVKFYLDYLREVDGYLVTIPSTSPENYFVDDKGGVHALTYASTMDITIIKELFANYLTIQDILGLEKDKEVLNALKKLPPFKIGKTGTLCEWFVDYTENDVHHRHVSHLYGLYPGNLIKDKELKKACETSLNRRGDDGTGWCIAWKACLYARLKEAESALNLLKNQLRYTVEENIKVTGGGTYPNLFCAHPPFQIDGNFGFAAAVIEMILQSDEERIELLPALPKAFNTGFVKGIRAKGGYSLDVDWENGKVTHIVIRAKKYGSVKLCYNGNEENLIFDKDSLSKEIKIC